MWDMGLKKRGWTIFFQSYRVLKFLNYRTIYVILKQTHQKTTRIHDKPWFLTISFYHLSRQFIAIVFLSSTYHIKLVKTNIYQYHIVDIVGCISQYPMMSQLSSHYTPRMVLHKLQWLRHSWPRWAAAEVETRIDFGWRCKKLGMGQNIQNPSKPWWTSFNSWQSDAHSISFPTCKW